MYISIKILLIQDAIPVANLDFTNDLPTDEPIDFEYNSDGDKCRYFKFWQAKTSC